jgi:hypothetical protein
MPYVIVDLVYFILFNNMACFSAGIPHSDPRLPHLPSWNNNKNRNDFIKINKGTKVF